MRKLILLFVLVLVACTTGQQAVPLGEAPVPEAPVNDCADVQCGAHSSCFGGVCSCDNGYKMCDGACISEESCCSDSDCSEGETCKSGKCTFDCSAIECSSNKVCFEKSKGCLCPDNYKWCGLQNQCIPKDNCCGAFDCGREEYCIKTIDSGQLCIFGNQKICKFVGLGAKEFRFEDMTFNVVGKKFFYGNSAILDINGEEYELKPKDEITVGDYTMKLESLKTTGGICQDRRDKDD